MRKADSVPTLPISAATDASQSTCPKCGTKLNSGKPSCCAPGGAWFKNCGTDGDTQFGHTWHEGLQACKRKFVITRIHANRPLKWFLFVRISPDVVKARNTLAPLASVTGAPPSTCPKCGVNKAGKRSCCFRDGAWFKNCGADGDTQFDHTWLEGGQACEGETLVDALAIFSRSTEHWTIVVFVPISSDDAKTTPIVKTSPSTCAKCGTKKKSGKRSCCYLGGAWFKKCGEESNQDFDHTWLEGIRACEDVREEAQGQAVLSDQTNNTLRRSDSQHHVNGVISGAGGDTDNGHSRSYASLSVLISVLLVAVQIQASDT